MSRWTVLATAVAGVLVGVLGMLGWAAYAGTSVPTGERAAIERVVREYILSHPEILPQAMQKLQDREAADQTARAGRVAFDNRAAITKPFGSAWAGSAAPDVVLVEYFDYNCGYCRASLPAITQLLASDPKVRVVYREFPILNDASIAAARMSLAAAEQGRFQRFHDALYAGGPVSDGTIAVAAAAAGLDLARARAFMPQADAELAATKAIAERLELRGTPSWVIGRKVVPYALPLEGLRAAVAEARARR